MTDELVNIQKDIIRVMDFMQTDALFLLIPLLLPFFIGSILLTIGLSKQAAISKKPTIIFIVAFSMGLLAAIAGKAFSITIPYLTLAVLGLFAMGQALTGYELIRASVNNNYKLSLSIPRSLTKNH